MLIAKTVPKDITKVKSMVNVNRVLVLLQSPIMRTPVMFLPNTKKVVYYVFAKPVTKAKFVTGRTDSSCTLSLASCIYQEIRD